MWALLDLCDCGRLEASCRVVVFALDSVVSALRCETVVLPLLNLGSGLALRLLRIQHDGGQQGSKEKALSV